MTAIHQFVPMLHRADAVGRHTLRLRDVMAGRGITSHLYVEMTDPETASESLQRYLARTTAAFTALDDPIGLGDAALVAYLRHQIDGVTQPAGIAATRAQQHYARGGDRLRSTVAVAALVDDADDRRQRGENCRDRFLRGRLVPIAGDRGYDLELGMPLHAFENTGVDRVVDGVLCGVVSSITDADLALLWKALLQMFEQDRSATRGQMSARGLYVFKHASALGNAPAHRLQATVKVARNPGVVRSFADFIITPPSGRESVELRPVGRSDRDVADR